MSRPKCPVTETARPNWPDRIGQTVTAQTETARPNHRRSQGGQRNHGPHKFLEDIVILCFERRFSKQNSVIRLRSNILAPPKCLGWLRHWTESARPKSRVPPSWPQWKGKSQFYLSVRWNTWQISITPQGNTVKPENVRPILITTEGKSSFLCVQTNWVCQSDVSRFCKNDASLESLIVTRGDSSHSVKNVTGVESLKS